VLPSLFGFKRDDTKTGLVSGRFQASGPFFPGPEDPTNLDIVDFVGDILSVRGGDFEKSEDVSSSTPPLPLLFRSLSRMASWLLLTHEPVWEVLWAPKPPTKCFL
jgi:hypothetical protein